MKQSWCPLWSDITLSSLWGEPKHVRILFITMLAIKDQIGFVRGSVGTLARSAVLTKKEVIDAVKVLEDPDPDTITAEHEGRRIRRTEDGWMVLNHAKYLERMKEEYAKHRRTYQAEWMKRKRAKSKKAAPLPPKSIEQSIQDARDEGRMLPRPPMPPPEPPDDTPESPIPF